MWGGKLLRRTINGGYAVDAFLDQYDIVPDLVRGFLGALRDSSASDRTVEA
jgi:hypothetical protein